ncbi:hypothetical protein L7F22_060544 [Adiantum nelumboides]|nr:hypothetical protein [Adiantum nelumboides]
MGDHYANPILVPSSIPEQRPPSSLSALDAFPTVFVPASTEWEALPILVEGIIKQKVAIEQALHRSGAVLFRGKSSSPLTSMMSLRPSATTTLHTEVMEMHRRHP